MSRHEFYKCKAWYQVSHAYRKHVHNLCERCGCPTWRKNDPNFQRLKDNGEDVRHGIVHHKVYINDTNVNDPYITLSFDNLELLCINCHSKEHFDKTQEIRDDVEFDANGRLIAKYPPFSK